MLLRLTLGLVLFGAGSTLPGAFSAEHPTSRPASCIGLTFEAIGGGWPELLGIPPMRRVRVTLCATKEHRAATDADDKATKSPGPEIGLMLNGRSTGRY
jgi:hypothetical protein